MNEANERIQAIRDRIAELMDIKKRPFKHAAHDSADWMEKAPDEIAVHLDNLQYLLDEMLLQQPKLRAVEGGKAS
jgi:hypothetical protein